MRSLIAVFAAGLLIASFQPASPVAASTLSGGWLDAGNLSTSRYGQLMGIVLKDGRVLVTGGSSATFPMGRVDIYTPGHGWSVTSKLQYDVLDAVLAPLPDGGALLAGGVPAFQGDGPGPGPITSAMTYNAARGVWAKAPAMRAARSGATATVLPGGRVLVAGGFDRRVIQLPNPDPKNQGLCCIDIQILILASSELFDPSSRTWSAGPSLAHARFGGSAVALEGGQVLVVGGSDHQNPDRPLDSAERFEPAVGRWVSAGSIGAPRTLFTLTALADGRALLSGGLDVDGSTILRSTMLYDPAQNQWSPGPDLAEARASHAAALLKDGRVLVTGGVDRLGRLSSSELFNPSAGSWSPTGALQSRRSDHLAITLADGRVLAVQGRGPDGLLSSSEMFDLNIAGNPPAARAVPGPGRWQVVGTQPVVINDQCRGWCDPRARILPDGRVLVVPGGVYGTFKVHVYDTRTGTWSTPINRTDSKSFFAAVTLASGNVLLLTLDSNSSVSTMHPVQATGRAEILDVSTGTVKPAASPGKLGPSRLDLLPDGRVWLTTEYRNALFYDPVANRWTRAPNLPSDIYVGTVTAVSLGRVLVGGTDKAMTFDPASKKWTNAGAFGASWSQYSATKLPSGDVLFAGGSESTTYPDGRYETVPTTKLMRWNHATGLVAPAQSMPSTHLFHATAVLTDGRVLFVGGVSPSPNNPVNFGYPDPLPRVELYDPAKDSWSLAAQLPEARTELTAISMPDGTVLVMGGNGLFGAAPTLQFTPGATLGSPTPASLTPVSPKAAAAAVVDSSKPPLAIFAAASLVLIAAIVGYLILRRRRQH